MISNMLGGTLGLELLLQPEVLLAFLEEEEPMTAETLPIVRGVSWLSDPKDASEKAAPEGAPPDVGDWTCPRCRSHRCIRTNPGDAREAVYCCSVCGYTFSGS